MQEANAAENLLTCDRSALSPESDNETSGGGLILALCGGSFLLAGKCSNKMQHVKLCCLLKESGRGSVDWQYEVLR